MKKKDKINIIFIIIFLILILINHNLILIKTLSFTEVFLKKLFPSIFIIYILTNLLIDYGFINLLNNLKLNGNVIYVLLMSLIGGYPSGTKYTKELLKKNLITIKEANYLIKFTHFPNPFFMLHIIPTLIGHKYTKAIYYSLIISNIIILFLFKKSIKNNNINKNIDIYNTNFSDSLNTATINSLKTVIIIYSSSLLFYIVYILISKYIIMSNEINVITNCIFDLTTGIIKINILNNTKLKNLIILFFICFGNIPIHIQIKSIISDTYISYNSFFIGRILSIIISIFIFKFITLI